MGPCHASAGKLTIVIDLRSDTVTRPGPEMRKVVADAVVGDDVWGDDPTVTDLEATTASLLGKEAGLFVSSGTQGNLCALMAHCQRGDEYLVGEGAHTYRYEAGGAAVLASIQPQPVRTLPDGRLDLDHAASVIKPDDPHFAVTKLLCVENTHDGKVLPLEFGSEAAALAAANGLALHLDGARLWNAAVALDVEPAAVAAPFDSASVCLSKGLGAPMGSVLVGSEELIGRARRHRKILGGGLRQAGMMAAAGIYALEHHRHRLADDHRNAERLAAGLGDLPGVTIEGQATNMVFVAFEADPAPVIAACTDNDILIAVSGTRSRMVTHLDVTAAEVEQVIEVVARTVN